MLGKTSLSAIRALMELARHDRVACLSPRRLADSLGESPTYMAKVVRHMVRAGILEAEKGAKGGVRLLQDPEKITLLSVVEACQGAIVGDFCKSTRPCVNICGFHRAAMELHEAITGVLSHWTLADLLVRSAGMVETGEPGTCLLTRKKFTTQSGAGAGWPLTQLGADS